MRRSGQILTMLFLACLSPGCVGHLETPQAVPHAEPPTEIERELRLHDETVTTHLTASTGIATKPLLIYATGDGGWGGRDLEVYRELVSWGYPIAGFSSSNYLNHLDPDSNQLTPDDVARDFEAVIETGRVWMMLPAPTPVVLVGVSRGADLAVAAAGNDILRRHLQGVVAVGLSKEEEYVRSTSGTSPEMLKLYAYLPRLGELPLSVIQSTHDSYLPAESARVLFGPDTIRRRLLAIEARDHTFSDARPAMYEAIEESLAWIESQPAPSAGP